MKVHLNVSGLLLGAVFLAFSLTPSLLPRPPLLQGVLSGLSFADAWLGLTDPAGWSNEDLTRLRALFADR